MKKIRLTQGKHSLVDDNDYDWLNQWKWYAKFDGYNWYAARSKYLGYDNTKNQPISKTIRMHTVFFEIPVNMEVDHIDRNGLNNQRNNLRVITHQTNCLNRKKRIDNVSGYRGVSFKAQSSKWQAQGSINSKSVYLGLFNTKEKAAAAYHVFMMSRHKATGKLMDKKNKTNG